MPDPVPPPENFVEILERVWWRLDRALDPNILRACARYYVANSLLAGTTSLIDHHESPNFIEGSLDVLGDACADLGVRAALCYGATERNEGLEEGQRGLNESARFIRENQRPAIRGLMGVHASFTVSNSCLERAAQLCQDLDRSMHVHVAEDGADVRDAIDRGFAGPWERMNALGALPSGSLVIHGVHLSAAQVDRTQDAGHWLVQNPRSNEGNGVGYPDALRDADRVALGTDGYPADMPEEERTLLRLGRERGEEDVDLLARLPRGHALISSLFGAKHVALEDGAVADFVVLKDGAVQDVVVNGRFVVREGELVHADYEELEREARDAAARLWKKMEAL
jgi:cytosine/adenosine deaminase-related metal-dependent hydrolase